jgi:hypothetical protein
MDPKSIPPDYFTDPADGLSDKEINRRTDEMGIGDNGPLVDRAYTEALPFQFDRELVKNAIEAGATRIDVSPDWIDVGETNGTRYRYMIVDNGHGMTGEELVRYFNMISSSGRLMDTHGNFGVGAKISMMPWNPHGVVIMSWKSGAGSMVRIVKKPNGNYALWRCDELDERGEPTGRHLNYVDAPEKYHPRFDGTESDGTVIVAQGLTGIEDTYMGPDLEPKGMIHVPQLNARFFELPEAVKLRAYAFTSDKRDTWPTAAVLNSTTGAYRTIQGARYFLDAHSSEHTRGSVRVPGAIIYWWLLNPERQFSTTNPAGYVAALYRDELGSELYNIAHGQRARQRFHQFGIVERAVYKDLTLIVEPAKFVKGKLEGVYPNTARSELLYAGRTDLPWEAWGEFFMEEMPEAIRKAIADAASAQGDETKDVAEKVKPFLARMRTTHYRPNVKGSQLVEPNARGPKPTRKFEPKPPRPPRPPRTPSPNGGTDTPNRDAAQPTNAGRPASPVVPRLGVPEIRWLSDDDKDNPRDGELEGRAAEYVEAKHLLLCNADFFVFKEVVEYWASQYRQLPGSADIIRDIVRGVYATELGSRITHARSLEGTSDWTPDDWRKLTSSEALTLAVLGLVGADAQIAPKIGGRFGAAVRQKPKVAKAG